EMEFWRMEGRIFVSLFGFRGPFGRRAGYGFAIAVPDFDFASAMSALLITPSAVRSSRKLALVTLVPDCDLVCAMSAEFTCRSCVVSPTSNGNVAEIALLMSP